MANPPDQPDARAEPVLSVEDLAVSFDNGPGSPRVRAVDGVRMTLHQRQTLAVVGESGCGKSVTAMSALRLIPRPPGRFDGGRVIYRRPENNERLNLLDIDDRTMRDIRGNDIAMIFQEPMTSLNPVFTVGEQLVEAIRLHQGGSSKQAAATAVDAMHAVGIPDPESRLKAYPHQFSGGMRQRVMIAMALACEPRVLLADEPTTALDVTIQAQILDLLGELKRERAMAVMLITHDLGVVAQHADVVCVMYAGRVVEYARVQELYANPLHPYTRGLLACIPTLAERRERLRTVAEVVEDEASFVGIDGLPEGARAWWPWHNGPGGSAYALRAVAPEHWIGIWDTPEAADLPTEPPDCPPLAEPSAAPGLAAAPEG